ncbi:Cof-type HAD-IIB family hydrolase [Virgibacillus pantothenticus]|uniref:Cof-type HAD-IIB family hydrolase n=1 Tax=Virgibacillus pantothenticus TaxID=1473 RepID=UPI001BAF55DE|nr:Cof-type HAD-IIB family hydrolase [Virgibacillus pantothenticus]
MKLIAIDLDGTLLNDSGKLNSYDVNIIKKVLQAGHKIAICTGRAAFDVQALFKNNLEGISIIASNGANILNTDHQLIDSTPINRPSIKKLLNYLIHQDLYFELTTSHEIKVPINGKEILQREIDKVISQAPNISEQKLWGKAIPQFTQAGIKPINKSAIDQLARKNIIDIYKVLVFSYDHTKLLTTAHTFTNDKELSLTSSAKYNVEIISQHTDKGIAVNSLANYYHIANEDIVVIGDSHNDLSMFQAATIKIAMENAIPEIKELSTFITRSNNQNGVAYALEHQLQLTQ